MRRNLRAALAVALAAGLAVVTLGRADLVPVLAVQADDSGLVADLAGLERQLADVPLMATVTIGPDVTWGAVRGDLVGARVRLDGASDALRSLHERAAGARTPVGEAVAQVAVSYRTLREGYQQLAVYEQLRLAALTGAAANNQLDLTVDEARGRAQIGLTLLLEALDGFHDGYAALRDAQGVDGPDRELFSQRYAAVQAVAASDGASARVALSRPSSQVLIAVDRFSVGVGGEPSGQVVRYACIDRARYLALREAIEEALEAGEEGEEGEAGETLEAALEADAAGLAFPDCPDLDNDNEVRLITP